MVNVIYGNEPDIIELSDSDQIRSNRNKMVNFISLMDYKKLRIAKRDGYDWEPVFKKAIEEAKKISGTIISPRGVFDIYSDLLFGEYVNMLGAGSSPSGTVISYKGVAGGWGIRTAGLHQRNQFTSFRLEMNGLGNGIKLGDYYANLLPNQVPIGIDLYNVGVSGIGSAYTSILTVNLSHYLFMSVTCGWGASAGKGLVIYADGYNSGVGTFINCTLGRVDANSVGLEIDGTVNLDCFKFIGCYYGGKTPIKIGSTNTFVRNVNMDGHIEGRNIGQVVNMVELFNVLGGEMKFTFAGFKEPNTNAVSFKGTVKHVDVTGHEANGIKGVIYKNDGAVLIENCKLSAIELTNESTATQFSANFPRRNFLYGDKRFLTENANLDYLYSYDGLTKIHISGSNQSPAVDNPLVGWTKSDYRRNTNPSELGTAGSKYVIKGWICVSTGTPGTWVEDRGLTGN